MVVISKFEQKELRKQLGNVHIARTKHHAYAEERGDVLKFLIALRKGQ